MIGAAYRSALKTLSIFPLPFASLYPCLHCNFVFSFPQSLAHTSYHPCTMEEKKETTASHHSSENATSYEVGQQTTHREKWPRRFVDSFKRDPNAYVTPAGAVGADGRVFDLESAARNTANSPLERKLKGRHMQMIAIGGSIGTGLFVGSGATLATGGPASILIAYSIIGIMLYFVVHALGELAVLFPVAGSFSAFSTRFIDPAWGFSMGYKSVCLDLDVHRFIDTSQLCMCRQ